MTWIKNLNIVRNRTTNARVSLQIRNVLDAPPSKFGLAILNATLML
jgi:hypothetical protein